VTSEFVVVQIMSSLMKDNLPVVIAVSGGTALLATYLYQKNKDNAKYPPGPTSFPFVGNLFQLSTKRNCIPGLFNRWANRSVCILCNCIESPSSSTSSVYKLHSAYISGT